MKQLIRRLSRVADSSSTSYCLLRSDTTRRSNNNSNSSSSTFRRVTARSKKSSASSLGGGNGGSSSSVPSGHLPVYVGEEMERFIVSADLLNHPIFVKLLNKSAQVYGYEQKGALRIPCHVAVFESILDTICRRGGHGCDDVSLEFYDEIINSSMAANGIEDEEEMF